MAAQIDVRANLLEVISEQQKTHSNLQSISVLREVERRLPVGGHDIELAIMTQFHELFRTGYLAWGFNLANPNPPFFHLTEQGFRALEKLSRDPSNPRGYLAHLSSKVTLNPIALSYLRESLDCYVAGLVKASAVMIGAAAESMLIELRDETTTRLEASGKQVPKAMTDWRARTFANALQEFIEQQKPSIPKALYEDFEGRWPSLTHDLRRVRNDAGHPASVEPITEPRAHASLLTFPDLAELIDSLKRWVRTDLR